MSIINLLIVFVVIGLSGCSSNSRSNYDAATSCGSAIPLCLAVAAAADIATNDGGSSRKCSDMTGEQRKQCTTQVESLKKHIKDASTK